MNRENNVVTLRHVKDDYLNIPLKELAAAAKNILVRKVHTDGDVLILGYYLDAVISQDLPDGGLMDEVKKTALRYLMDVLETDNRGGARLAKLADKSWALFDMRDDLMVDGN